MPHRGLPCRLQHPNPHCKANRVDNGDTRLESRYNFDEALQLLRVVHLQDLATCSAMSAEQRRAWFGTLHSSGTANTMASIDELVDWHATKPEEPAQGDTTEDISAEPTLTSCMSSLQAVPARTQERTSRYSGAPEIANTWSGPTRPPAGEHRSRRESVEFRRGKHRPDARQEEKHRPDACESSFPMYESSFSTTPKATSSPLTPKASSMPLTPKARRMSIENAHNDRAADGGSPDVTDGKPSGMSHIGSLERGDSVEAISTEGTMLNGSLRLLQHWDVPEGDESCADTMGRSVFNKQSRAASKPQLVRGHNVIKLLESDNLEMIGTSSILFRFIAYPSSMQRMCWDLFGAFLFVFCDLFLLPLSVFDISESTVVSVADWTSASFWTLDILAAFTTGYMTEHVIVMDPVQIAKRYVQTWFVIDVCLVFIEWLTCLVESSVAQQASILRVCKIVRLARIVRLAKLQRVLSDIRSVICLESTSAVIDTLKLLAFVLMLNHVIACLFYWVGELSEDHHHQDHHRRNWIRRLPSNATYLKYVSSLHWSLTQFTPASTDIHPVNMTERSFNIAILVLGLVIFSGLVSTITSSLVQIRKRSEEHTRQCWLLRRFLKERGVPLLLSTRIQNYLEHIVAMQSSRIQEESVTFLAFLSDGLRSELQYCTKAKYVLPHTLFAFIDSVAESAMQRIVHAIDQTLMAKGDALFYVDEEASSMHFIVCGNLMYGCDVGSRKVAMDVGNDELSGAGTVCYRDVWPHDWVCEVALWAYWVHTGNLFARVESELVTIDSKQFGAVVKSNPSTFILMVYYARAYVEQANEVRERGEHQGFELHLCTQKGDPRVNHIDYAHLKQVLQNCMNGESGPSWEEYKSRKSLHRKSMAALSTTRTHSGLPQKGKGGIGAFFKRRTMIMMGSSNAT